MGFTIVVRAFSFLVASCGIAFAQYAGGISAGLRLSPEQSARVIESMENQSSLLQMQGMKLKPRWLIISANTDVLELNNMGEANGRIVSAARTGAAERPGEKIFLRFQTLEEDGWR